MVVPASPQARGFAVSYFEFLSNMATSDLQLQPNSVRLMPGGLGKIVEDGFTLLGPGVMSDRDNPRTEEHMKPISAEKLIYKIIKD